MATFNKMRRALMAGAMATFGFSLSSGQTVAADFPAKPVSLIIPYGAGGSTDTMGRVFANALGEALGQPVVVVNRKGGGGSVGASFLKNSKADGYTLLLGGIDEITVWNPIVNDVDFAASDFRFLGSVGAYQNAFVAPAGQPYSTLEEFVAFAKANPGTAVVSQGGMAALFIEKVAQQEGLEFRTVNANSGSEAMQLLLAGNALMSYSGGIHANYEGQIDVLASLNESRLPGYPDKPTLKEAGFDLTMPSLLGIISPAALPDEIAAQLEAAIQTAAAHPDFVTIVEERLKSKVQVLDAAGVTAAIAEIEVQLKELAGK